MNTIIELNQYTTGDALAQAALTFAVERVEYAGTLAARIGTRGVQDNVRRKVAIRAIERAEDQLRAAKAILGVDL